MEYTPADILYKAADRVQFIGWTQKVGSRDAQGRFVHCTSDEAREWCIAGAIGKEVDVATNDDALQIILISDTLKYLGQVIPGSFITPWNDAPERTADEVADMLRSAAKKWENENGSSEV